MTSDGDSKPLREGSARKRAAILTAARDLFFADGFERSSVDAVAARAGVSKRTVYDYYGDKRALLLAVVEEAGRSLMESIDLAIADNLSGVKDPELALTAFSAQVARSTLGTAEYAALVRLVSRESAHLPELHDHWLGDAPEKAIAERFAQFGRDGLLDVPDPRLAADHFVALTFHLAINGRREAGVAEDVQVERVIVEGVRAFLRAYAVRPRQRSKGARRPEAPPRSASHGD